MVMTDPIADLLTRIRNGYQAQREAVEIPDSKIKREVARVLQEGGYVFNSEVVEAEKRKILRVYLLYREGKIPAIEEIRRKSKPGRRIYVNKDEIPQVLNGLGMAVVSTSKGVLSDREARNLGVGGELLLEVW